LYYFTSNTHNTFTVQFPNLVTVQFYCSSRHNLQQLLQVSSTWLNACMDTSGHRLLHTFRGPGELRMVWQPSETRCCSIWTFAIRAKCTWAIEYPHTSVSNGL